MDVVEADISGEPLEDFGKLVKGASFESGVREVPVVFAFPINALMLGICFFTLGENTPSAPHQEGEKGVGALDTAMKVAREAEDLSFGDKMAQMFAVSMPDGIDVTLLTDVMGEWKEFWMLPAMMALGVVVIFGLFFIDRTKVDEDAEEVLAEAAEAPEEMP